MRQLLNVGNFFVRALLRSPFHVLISRGVMLITVTGHKSGRKYTTPVQYVRQGDMVTVFTRRGRTWWRNLQGGALVILHIRGKPVVGMAKPLIDEEAAAAACDAFEGTSLERAAASAEDGVIVQIQLVPEAAPTPP